MAAIAAAAVVVDVDIDIYIYIYLLVIWTKSIHLFIYFLHVFKSLLFALKCVFVSIFSISKNILG